MKNWPIIPTIVVAAAVAIMIGLGIWQLQRMGEKEALLERYAAAQNLPSVTYPTVPVEGDLPLFRKSAISCLKVVGWQSVAGKNIDGKSGIAHLAECQTSGGEGPGALVAVGWTNKLTNPSWTGGTVNGVIAPETNRVIKLVVTDEINGVQKLAPPSTQSIPNNHLMYAVQWFFFALAAAVIFFIAVRKKQADS